jgi:hypothetical protein
MLIPRSVFCLSKLCDSGSSRFALGCVLFERIDDEWCRAVVTDGRCMVVAEWRENHEFDAMFGNFPLKGVPGARVLVPAASCETLRRLACDWCSQGGPRDEHGNHPDGECMAWTDTEAEEAAKAREGK